MHQGRIAEYADDLLLDATPISLCMRLYTVVIDTARNAATSRTVKH